MWLSSYLYQFDVIRIYSSQTFLPIFGQYITSLEPLIQSLENKNNKELIHTPETEC